MNIVNNLISGAVGVAIIGVTGYVAYQAYQCRNSQYSLVSCLLGRSLENAGKAALTVAQDATKAATVVASDVENKIGTTIDKTFHTTVGKKMGFYPGAKHTTADVVDHALNVSLITSAGLTAPIVFGVEAGQAIFDKDRRKKLDACGHKKGWDRFSCGTKTFFGFG